MTYFYFAKMWQDDKGTEYSERLEFPVRSGDRNAALLEARRSFEGAKEFHWATPSMVRPGLTSIYEVMESGLHREVFPGHDKGQDDVPSGGGHEYFRKQLARFLGREVP